MHRNRPPSLLSFSILFQKSSHSTEQDNEGRADSITQSQCTGNHLSTAVPVFGECGLGGLILLQSHYSRKTRLTVFYTMAWENRQGKKAHRFRSREMRYLRMLRASSCLPISVQKNVFYLAGVPDSLLAQSKSWRNTISHILFTEASCKYINGLIIV